MARRRIHSGSAHQQWLGRHYMHHARKTVCDKMTTDRAP